MKSGPVIAALAAILLASIVVWAGLRALSGYEFRQADSVAAEVISGGRVPEAELRRALGHIDKAMRFFPRNPDYLDLKGQLLEMLADVPGTPGGEYKALLQQAGEQYRLAIARRPLWPYSWSNLMSVKDKQDQIDGEFFHAFERSSELGPWEPRIQLQLIRSGLSMWQVLGAGRQEMLREIINRAIQRQPREVFSLVRLYNRPDLLCDINHNQGAITRWCRRLGWPAGDTGSQ